MSLFPYSHNPYCYSYQPIVTNNGVFECLSNAHEMGMDHSQLIKHLRQAMLSSSQNIQAYAVPICKYLRNNLQMNIQIIDTVFCLPIVHDYASPLAKKQISAILSDKYPSSVCFFDQITTLATINLSLVEPFVCLMRGLSGWFRKEVEEKDYRNVEHYELEYLINSLYAQERYKFDNGLHIEGNEGNQCVLALYRITTNLSMKIQPQLWTKLMNCIFYYLCNMGIAITPTSKYIFFSIGEIMSLQRSLIDEQNGMVNVIMEKARKAAQRQQKEEVEGVIGLLRDGIVNLLCCFWTVQVECFWLWRFKLICDLLSIEDNRQIQLIREVRAIYRQISKYINA